MIKWIKSLFKKKPKITFKNGEMDTENQIQPLHVYKDGEYSHTVKMHYFTEEQFEEISKIRDDIYDEYDNQTNIK